MLWRAFPGFWPNIDLLILPELEAIRSRSRDVFIGCTRKLGATNSPNLVVFRA